MNGEKRKLLDGMRKKEKKECQRSFFFFFFFFFQVGRWLPSWSNLTSADYVKALLQIKICKTWPPALKEITAQ